MICHIDFKCCSVNLHNSRKQPANHKHLGIDPLILTWLNNTQKFVISEDEETLLLLMVVCICKILFLCDLHFKKRKPWKTWVDTKKLWKWIRRWKLWMLITKLVSDLQLQNHYGYQTYFRINSIYKLSSTFAHFIRCSSPTILVHLLYSFLYSIIASSSIISLFMSLIPSPCTLTAIPFKDYDFSSVNFLDFKLLVLLVSTYGLTFWLSFFHWYSIRSFGWYFWLM